MLSVNIEVVFGVKYYHVRLADGADLYVTGYGRPFLENLRAENSYTDREWFDNHHVRLPGTSCPCRVKTKHLSGRSTEVVLKWNRMGQQVIRDEEDEHLDDAEFNSPFEEFALVMELKSSRSGCFDWVITQDPLAIYVPLERAELCQIGRKDYKMRVLCSRHEREVELDIFREYAVIYRWLPGIDLAQAYRHGVVSKAEMNRLTLMAEKDLRRNGFLVRDQKPHHVIVKPDRSGTKLEKTECGRVVYGLVDFELLERVSSNR